MINAKEFHCVEYKTWKEAHWYAVSGNDPFKLCRMLCQLACRDVQISSPTSRNVNINALFSP